MPLYPTADRSRGLLPKFLTFVPMDVALVALAVFIAAVLGTASRPTGFLAVFWPANAWLAGIMVREERFRTIPVLLAACAGYLCAAFVFGDTTGNAVLLTTANLVGVVAFTLMFGALDPIDRTLSRPQGVISMLVMAGAASGLAGLVGGIAMSGITQLNYVDALMSWFAAELVNYLALLPVMLTVPQPRNWWHRPRMQALREAVPPVLAVAFTMTLSLMVQHPIAIVFPVPALIWCALTLPMSATAVLVMFYSGVAMLGLKLGLFDLGAMLTGDSITATHLGVALVALGPVVIASVNTDRRRQIEHLERLTRYDQLTDALSRAAFFELGGAQVEKLQREGAPLAVLVVDADHFKAINDLHGHPSGDRVLVAIAAAMQISIRQGDLFGRLGGEEFALVLPHVTRREAAAVAERARRAVERLSVVVGGGAVQKVTISIGVAYAERASVNLTEMVSLADRAMYEAKNAGRNRVTVREL